MNVTGNDIVWLVAASSAISTTLFWAVFYAGRVWQKLTHAHERLDEHDIEIGELKHRRATDRHYGSIS